MPGKVDETKWSEAKAAARKQYPDVGEKNPKFWKIVSSIYKKMDGKFSKKMEKSLTDLEALCRKNPERYGFWDESSMQDTPPVESLVAKSIAGQFSGHAEAPGDLEKAAGGVHKYTSRVPLPGGGFRYIYPEGQGPGKQDAQGAVKKPAPPIKKTPGSTKPGMKDAVEKVGKKDAAASKAELKRKEDDDEAKKKKVEKAQDPEFEAFSKAHREDIKKSLAESHPNWDAETLERRVEPQVRQMFRIHGG